LISVKSDDIVRHEDTSTATVTNNKWCVMVCNTETFVLGRIKTLLCKLGAYLWKHTIDQSVTVQFSGRITEKTIMEFV